MGGVQVTNFVEQPDVETRLQQMGLTLEALQRVVRAAGGAYNSTTHFHPSAAPGTYMYHEGTAALRRSLVPLGYDYDEYGRQPRTFSVEIGVTIVFQTGDENTGLLNGIEPTTRHPKGNATRAKVSENDNQLALFNLANLEAPTTVTLTWIFLAAVVGDVVRAELSLPRAFSEDGKPSGWVERIVLPEEPLASTIRVTDPSATDENSTAVDVDVEWKQ